MSTKKKYLLGMDCGTTNIKAVILSEEGTTVAEASRPSTFISPGQNMQEQDANDWWRQSVEIFQSLAQQAGPEVVKNIQGISISSHTVSMLPVDKDGVPVRNAMTYQDSRSVEELQYIVDKVGFEKFVKIVGGQPSVAFLPCKILWFKKHEPELFARTAAFLQASSYINFKLTGVMSSDIDQATRTQCLNMSRLSWSRSIGDAIGIDLNRYMPRLYLVDEIIGKVTREAAQETGLVAGIPVIAGCSDAMASMFALGLSELGQAGESSGTTSLVFVGAKKKSRMDLPVITRPCAISGMPWVFDAPIQTSGAALKWFVDKFAAEEREYCEKNGLNIFDYLNERALQAPAGSNGLLFLPYLLGERAPLWNDYARGLFVGLDMNMSRDDLIRSIFEGTAFALRNVVETVRKSGGKCESLRICGGGAKSRTWAMIKASMLNCPVYLLDDSCGDVPVGDALLVGNRVGVFGSLAEGVEKTIKVKEVIEPNPQWAAVYDKMYAHYVKVYENLDEELKVMRRDVLDIQQTQLEEKQREEMNSRDTVA
ncbi:MAG: FGGY-family carbohydrate kinase [Agathobacter sp.]|uniref:xylulokinase n=1 Tax=Agathobacter sp. TaxID=2021311 RepID=UPI00257CBA4F|nr:FGGY-family carbohydrate kinase [Agathobacter sp.]MBQ1681787.1 FGGY-family carbohydrate kinase [Agathobacter sp.]